MLLVEVAKLGQPIPPDTTHAVSVSLPTWRANVGYEEGQEWVVSRMTTGYPRFFIHKTINKLAELIAQKFALPGEKVMLFPSHSAAERCLSFISSKITADSFTHQQPRILDLVTTPQPEASTADIAFSITAVLFCEEHARVAKSFWQHTGEGVSSRRAEYFLQMYNGGMLQERETAIALQRNAKGPKRYRKYGAGSISEIITNGTEQRDRENGTIPQVNGNTERTRFLEERFGRNLNSELAHDAKLAIKRRIAGSLTTDTSLCEALQLAPEASRLRGVIGLSEDDVYLFGSGMNSIYTAHRILMKSRGEKQSICFGFPYIDTLKVLEKFGPGCMFYGRGSDEELDELEQRLVSGENFLALFCETPSNPLLHFPNLQRIRSLADRYGFAIVIDETVGNFLNVNVLPSADIVVSSLTKIFSGDSNVMGGALILNPNSTYYTLLKRAMGASYEDNLWPEDAVFVERNSRDFVSRIKRINTNAEAICDILQSHPRIKNVYYPKTNPSRCYYDACRTQSGGYGGLLSATFYSTEEAAAFHDNLDTEKGPSLGTNFTLASPFVLLAHYTELDWAESHGVDRNLVRFSVGLEDTSTLVRKFEKALSAIPTK